MASLQTLILTERPSLVFNGSAFVLALLSLTDTPSFIPVVLLLSTLLLYIHIIHRRHAFFSHLSRFWATISLAAAAANFGSALHALSTPSTSMVALIGLSAVESAVALAIVVIYVKFRSQLKTAWAQSLLFPVLWATIWCGIAHISPIGRILMWTPIQGFWNYEWITRLVGPLGIDWVVAAYAVVLSEVIGAWLMGPGMEEDVTQNGGHVDDEIHIQELDGDRHRRTDSPKSRPILILGASLLALTLPAYITQSTPLAPSSITSTPLTVGCVLPSSIYDEVHELALENFIAASQKMTKAKVLIWPEGAVTFANPTARDMAFEEVRNKVPGTYVGVSFEEFAPSEPGGRVGMRRNGFALIAPSGVTDPPVKIQYYKRKLVPIAESFSVTPSRDPPMIYTLDLEKPSKNINKTTWAPAPDYTRPIPLTASICLDFASPSAFAELESRPALILAPGRTWHPDIGRTMWEQAKARAEELGSMVLWCDGGEGGVSGIAGGGISEIMQVGEGSWTRTIGLQWPFDEGRTVYASWGDGYTLMVFWTLLGCGWIGELALQHDLIHTVNGAFSRLVHAWRNGRQIAGERLALLG